MNFWRKSNEGEVKGMDQKGLRESKTLVVTMVFKIDYREETRTIVGRLGKRTQSPKRKISSNYQSNG